MNPGGHAPAPCTGTVPSDHCFPESLELFIGYVFELI